MATSLITVPQLDDIKKLLAIPHKLVNAGTSFPADRRCDNLRRSSFMKRISLRIPALHEERFTFHASEGGQIVAEGQPKQVARGYGFLHRTISRPATSQ